MGIINSCRNGLRRLSAAVDERISAFFRAFGGMVATWPWLFIFLTVGLTALLGVFGLYLNFEQEVDPFKLYASKSARSVEDGNYAQDKFGFPSIENRVLVIGKGGGYPNVLEPDSIKSNLMELMAIWEEINAAQLPQPLANFKFLCYKAAKGKPCKVESILSAWNYSMEILESDPDPLATINSVQSTLVDTYGRPVEMEFVLGGIGKNEKGEIVVARAFHLHFGIDLNLTPLEKAVFDKRRANGYYKHSEKKLKRVQGLIDKNWDPRAYMLDREVVNILREWHGNQTHQLKPYIWDLLEVQRESSDAVTKELIWILLSAVLVGGYTHAVFFRNSLTFSKAHLVGFSFFAIGMALVSSFGICLWMGIRYNVVVTSIPFMLMGLGIDDSFILIGQLRRTDYFLPPKERIQLMMARAGSSIFVTSLTDLIAFLLVLTSAVPALKAFGVYASLGIVFTFLYQITFFLGVITLETRREHRMVNGESMFGFKKWGRPFVSSDGENSDRIKAPANLEMAERGARIVDSSDSSFATSQGLDTSPEARTGSFSFPEQTPTSPQTPPTPKYLKKFFGKGTFDPSKPALNTKIFAQWVPKVTLSTPGSIAIILLELALLGVAAYGCSKVYMDFEFREWFSPKGSQMHAAFRIEEEFFFGEQHKFGVFTREGDYAANQVEMLKTVWAIRDNPFVAPLPRATSWFEDYVKWLGKSEHKPELVNNLAPNNTALVAWLHEFLKTEQGSFYLDLIKFNKDGSGIVATKLVEAYNEDVTSGSFGVEMMDSLAATCKKYLPELETFAFHVMYPFYDGLRVIEKQTIQNVMLSGSAVFFVCMITLANVVAAVEVLLMVALTDVMLLGLMWYVGLTFNMVTSINVMLAVGISVDFSAHIAHSFLCEEGTRKERAQKALEQIGGEVFSGGFTSLLAIIGLSPSTHYILQVYFKMFLAIIAFGLWHGLIILPIVLSYAGPSSYSKGAKQVSSNNAEGDNCPCVQTRGMRGQRMASEISLF